MELERVRFSRYCPALRSLRLEKFESGEGFLALLEVGTGFHPELTGRENIYMNGTILGMSRKEINEKLDEIVLFSGVEKHMDTPVKFYSSGMKVRLGFSVAAHLEPEILIIDEVLAVGDMEFQRKCLGKMEHVAESGRTVLFVSHNMDAINTLCGRCLLLNSGKIAYDGDTKTAIEKYLGVGNVSDLGVLRRVVEKEKAFFFADVSIVDNAGNLMSSPLHNGQELYLRLIVQIK
jgi:lipopolysaccharide transport system ATP-binding protein